MQKEKTESQLASALVACVQLGEEGREESERYSQEVRRFCVSDESDIEDR